MKITLLPKTRLGKQSIIFTIASWILFVVGSVMPSETGYSGFESIIQNPLQAIITVLIFAVSIMAFIVGLISIIKKQERSILVFLAILSGVSMIPSFFVVVANVFFG